MKDKTEFFEFAEGRPVFRILIACEESQEVTKSFRQLGHEAFSCDLQDCSGGHPEWHFKGDVIEQLDKEWDLIIGFPPCTYLTNGGAVRMFPKSGRIDLDRFNKAMDAKSFFMAIYKNKCSHIAIENPMPMSVVKLPQYAQLIHPYMFGHPFSKKTCLWLKNLPKLMPTKMMRSYQPYINGGGGRLHKHNYKDKTFANGSLIRSKTFPGIASAMAEQWSAFLHSKSVGANSKNSFHQTELWNTD